jgi:hypothetical protein
VFYDTAKINVARIKKLSGNLDKAIYQAFSPENSGQGVAEYHISWNAKTAPHGHLLENGFWQRYQVVMTRKGWVTLARPESAGKKKAAAQSQSGREGCVLPAPSWWAGLHPGQGIHARLAARGAGCCAGLG